ncbi:MAG: 4-hydroxy-tetrahydrodipicolinate synthase [Anaerovoracaceae bacterium]|nr:4-hydroxy-tetrahydrodipicolinate synthase [Anaerovoracaceae bacterium]
MKKRIFTGCATALITPLDENGVNFDAYGRLIDWQIEEGVDALVVAATTGEGSTLSDVEHKAVVRYAVERVNGRVPVIAGTGSNDTAYGIQLTQQACDDGVDGVLVVTPYYNKCTQNGLVKMYSEYADASSVPVIIYNVPGRTGVNIQPATYAKLAEHENIVAIKEANNDIASITETMSLVQGKLDLYSGNDDQIVPLLAVGGIGVISVLSNVAPRATHEMVAKFMEGDVKGACELQLKYRDLVKWLFCEVNPIPVKAAVEAMGFCENYLRSPLYPMEDANREKLLESMRNVGLID